MCRMLKPESNDASSTTKTYYEWESGGIPLHCHTHTHTHKKGPLSNNIWWSTFTAGQFSFSVPSHQNITSSPHVGKEGYHVPKYHSASPQCERSLHTYSALYQFSASPARTSSRTQEPNATLYQRTLLLLPCINPHRDQT